jgi:hypothetical protein
MDLRIEATHQDRQPMPGLVEQDQHDHDRLSREEDGKTGADGVYALFRDWDDLTTFHDFPAEHWLHLQTSNPIESVFSGLDLRTNVAKRARVREKAL